MPQVCLGAVGFCVPFRGRSGCRMTHRCARCIRAVSQGPAWPRRPSPADPHGYAAADGAATLHWLHLARHMCIAIREEREGYYRLRWIRLVTNANDQLCAVTLAGQL